MKVGDKVYFEYIEGTLDLQKILTVTKVTSKRVICGEYFRFAFSLNGKWLKGNGCIKKITPQEETQIRKNWAERCTFKHK